MKVVFIEDVPDVAEVGEIKEVADGYGRNYLIPKRLAVLADARATQIVEKQKKKKARIAAETEAEMRELANKIEGLDIVIKAKAGAKDRLYGSITNADIAEELNKSAGLVIDKRIIELEKPIQEIGNYEVPIRLTKDIIPRIKLSVIGEEKVEDKEKKESEGKEEKKAKKAIRAKKATKTKKALEKAAAEDQKKTVAEETKVEDQGEAVAEAAEAENQKETEQGV
ncbi:MAG: 50S ribosomal protein L9 [Dehalococcoidia bacterium]|nr:MAG: 50S ribosomal protein L9 [Dehalococcoidia bacterium]